MIVSNIQNISKRKNYPCSNLKFAYVDKTILKDEVSFGNKKPKPKKQDVETISDGINDIDNNSSKTSKSDLNTTEDGLSMQNILKKEDKKLKQLDIDINKIEIPKIDIPDVPDLELENLNKDIGKISEEFDKSTKSSMFKSILPELGIGIAVLGIIYYLLKKHKKHNNSLDKKV